MSDCDIIDHIMKKQLITLAIETSCDETASAVLEGEFSVLSSVVASQADLHEKYGGVVPELACRRHMELMQPVVAEAMEKAKKEFSDIDLVCVTNTPGLVGALLVGLSYAKGFAFARNLPLVGVNHLEGHITAAFLEKRDLPLPSLALLVSGGHTEFFMVDENRDMKWLGGTRDDAAGEAFDKVARVLSLGYPGGPLIERMADKGKARFNLPIALASSGKLEFSFSGPKTATKQLIDKLEKENEELPVADVCASFQKATVSALILKTKLAIEINSPESIIVAGGVACNGALREEMRKLGSELSIPVVIPTPHLCSDNAAMIGAVGAHKYMKDPDNPHWKDYMSLDAIPTFQAKLA